MRCAWQEQGGGKKVTSDPPRACTRMAPPRSTEGNPRKQAMAAGRDTIDERSLDIFWAENVDAPWRGSRPMACLTRRMVRAGDDGLRVTWTRGRHDGAKLALPSCRTKPLSIARLSNNLHGCVIYCVDTQRGREWRRSIHRALPRQATPIERSLG